MGDRSTKRGLDPTSPIRLRAARLRAGLSLGDLAQKLGGIVSKQAIAKYEKGLISPSPEVLENLLQVLEIPPSPDIPEEIPEEKEKFDSGIGACLSAKPRGDWLESKAIKFQNTNFLSFSRVKNELSQTPAERASRLK